MQEGLFSLMQMAKTSAAVAQLAESSIPYVVVLTDPTTGGAFASFASLGDVIFSEPGAYVAFAGTRVAQQAAQSKNLPLNYQLAEFQQDHGMIDKIVRAVSFRSRLPAPSPFSVSVQRSSARNRQRQIPRCRNLPHNSNGTY
jgi:acetyl-CoA carboxylase carboxyl transferase subunit beta